MSGEGQWPSELRLAKGGRMLRVVFEAGGTYDLAAEYLRVMSPSAEVRGHSAAERKTVGGKEQVAILEIEPVGTYAVRLHFDDLHATGIYTWNYLHELGDHHADLWAAYLAELAAKGLDRQTPGAR